MVGDIRYNAWSAELFAGPTTRIYRLKEERLAEGVESVAERDWLDARGICLGIGVRYDPYRMPFGVALRVRYAGERFNYVEYPVLSSGGTGMFETTERQKWISPEFWLSYQFTPKTFPVKTLDVCLRLGISADILTQDVMEGAFFEHPDQADWFGGQAFDLEPLISQNVYPSVLAAAVLDYRLGRNSIFMELQYRYPFLDEYAYQIQQAFRNADQLQAHQIGVQVGLRHVLYRPFYK